METQDETTRAVEDLFGQGVTLFATKAMA